MATNELQAKITADISGLESGLKKAQKLQSDYAKSISNTQKDIADNIAISKQYEKAIDQLNKELKDGTISQKDFQKQLKRIQRDEKETKVETANLRKELSRLKRDQKDLAATSKTASKGMATMGKSTANATPTVIEFSRVIQDAPYGIQGVANNIQQLTTNFGYLQKSAGGTVPALKALAGSFLGPAGIVFAVSTITSLLVTYGDKILSSVTSTNKLTEATKEYLGEATAEASQLQVLVGIAGDEAKSKGVRQKALEKLKDEYPDYLGFLNLETINTEKARIAVDELSKSLIRQAQIRGVSKLIEEKALELAEKEIEAKKEGIKTANRIIQSNKVTSKSYNEQREAFNTFGKNYKQVQDSILKKGKERIISENVKKETEEVKGEVNELISFLQSKLVEQFEFESLFKKKNKVEERVEVDLSIASELVPEGGGTIEKYIDLKRDEFGKVVRDRFGKAIKTNVDVGLELEDIPEFKLPKVNTGEYAQSLLDAQAAAKSFQEVTTPVFSAVASEIGKTFQTNSEIVNAAINSIISAGAKMLQQLIIQTVVGDGVKDASATKDIVRSQAATTGNAVKAASETASAAGPASAFLLPVLIGAAIGFVAATFAGIKFAHGGIVPGGSFTGDKIPAMLNSGEMVLNAGQQKNLFDILNNNLSSLQNRSSDNSNLIATTVLRGSDLYLTIEREKRKR